MSRSGCLVMVGIGVLILMATLSQVSPAARWVVVGCVALVIAAVLIYAATSNAAKKARPCRHGTRGAQMQPSFCTRCATEAAELKAETERKKAEAEERETRRVVEAAKQAEEERRRKHREDEEFRVRIRQLSFLLKMDPYEFEHLVCEVFRRQGYEIKETPKSGDHGVDGYLRREGKLYLLQCKRVEGNVGEPKLVQLLGSVTSEHADGGILVTTSGISGKARSWVRGKPIRIVEGEELVSMVRDAFPEGKVAPDGSEVPLMRRQPSAEAEAASKPARTRGIPNDDEDVETRTGDMETAASKNVPRGGESNRPNWFIGKVANRAEQTNEEQARGIKTERRVPREVEGTKPPSMGSPAAVQEPSRQAWELSLSELLAPLREAIRVDLGAVERQLSELELVNLAEDPNDAPPWFPEIDPRNNQPFSREARNDLFKELLLSYMGPSPLDSSGKTRLSPLLQSLGELLDDIREWGLAGLIPA